jgi:hypothetical protein
MLADGSPTAVRQHTQGIIHALCSSYAAVLLPRVSIEARAAAAAFAVVSFQDIDVPDAHLCAGNVLEPD